MYLTINLPTEMLLIDINQTPLTENMSAVSRMRCASPDYTQSKYYLNYWKMALSPWPVINPYSLLHSGSALTRRANRFHSKPGN